MCQVGLAHWRSHEPLGFPALSVAAYDRAVANLGRCVEGHLLLHMEFRGYRSDHDLSLQLWHVADAIQTILSDTLFVPSFIVTVFQGWRVVAVSWEVGGRIYACSEGGVVVALDYPLCHFEVRFVATSSPDSFGADADRLEMRFLSAGDRLDVAASVVQAPPSMLVVSRVSGPTLIRNAKWCREHGARVECPDQQLQLGQLAAVHAHWTATVEAPSEAEAGPRISAIAVESNPANVHLVCESPLLRKDRAIVKAEALALQCHDPLDEVVAKVMPPIVDGPAVQPAATAPRFAQALMGPAPSEAVVATPVSSEKPSVTDPGHAPGVGTFMGSSLAPPRRPLEQRRSEMMDCSAMTPQAFVDAARRTARASDQRPESHVTIEEFNSIEGETGPRSFRPPRPGQ